MVRIFEFGVWLFDCFIYRQNVTCLKRFTRNGHYADEVEDIIIGRLAIVLKSLPNINVQLRFDDAVLKIVGFVFVDTL